MRFAFYRPGSRDPELSLDHFGKQNLKLQLGQACADAAVDAMTERQVAPGIVAVDTKPCAIIEHGFVTIGREIPEHNLVTLAEKLTAKINILRRGAYGQRGIANE